ncbi:MAG: hypothetical protein KHW57_05490 [Clostridium sp.]|nr:hypothetical protein [Clostridium sp.]
MRKFVNLQSKYKNSKEEIFLMEENNVDIEKVKQIIQKLKIEILEKEDKINELLKIINDEVDEKSEEI